MPQPAVRSLFLGLLLVVGGCGRSIRGAWKGTCEAGVGVEAFDMPMVLEVQERDGDKVKGGGAFQYKDFPFTGALTGTFDDDALDAEIEGEAGGYTITTRVLLDRFDDELDGICAFEDQGVLYEGEVIFSAFEPGGD